MFASKNSKVLIPVYVFFHPVIPVSVKYLTGYLDNFTLNGCRIAAGTLALVGICLISKPGELDKVLRSRASRAIIGRIVLLFFLVQYLKVGGMARTSAMMGGLIEVLGFPCGIFMATVFFTDERSHVAHRNFILGALLAAIGTAGFTLSNKMDNVEFSTGTLMLLGGMLGSCFTAIWMKKACRNQDPYAVSAVLHLVLALFFLGSSLIFGTPRVLLEISMQVHLVLWGSGAFGVVLGGAVALLIIKVRGLVTYQVLSCICPLPTALVACWLLGESLTPAMVFFGAVQIAGCALALKKPPCATQVGGGLGEGDGKVILHAGQISAFQSRDR